MSPTPDLVALLAPTNDRHDDPYDFVNITEYVRTFSTSRGRDTELDDVQAGTASVSLSNKDRRFDPNYASSPYYPNLLPGTPLVLGIGYKWRVLGDSPASYWRMGEASGTFADERGVQVGTLTGSDNVRGVVGALTAGTDACLHFGGSDSYVTVPDDAAYDFDDTFSWEMWVYPTVDQQGIIFGKGLIGADLTSLHIIRTVGGGLSVISGALANVAVCTGTPLATLNTWYHVVYTKNGTSAGANAIYINGAEVTLTTDAAHNQANNSASIYIGATQVGPSNFFDGRIDEVAVYTGTVLTAQQVADHYDSGLNSPEHAIFTGFVDGWPQSYPLGDSDIVTNLRATDAFEGLQEDGYFDDPAYAEEVEADNPYAWWRMREESWPNGQPTFELTDSSGNGYRARHHAGRISIGGDPIVIDSPSVRYDEDSFGSGIGFAVLPSLPVSLEAWFLVTDPWEVSNNTTRSVVIKGSLYNEWYARVEIGRPLLFGPSPDFEVQETVMSQVRVTFDDGSNRYIGYLTNAQNIIDGRPHHVVITMATAGATGWKIYIDGVDRTPIEWTTSSTAIDANPNLAWGTRGFLTMSEIAVYDSELSPTRVAAHYNAANRPWDAEQAGARIARVLDGIGWPSSRRDLDDGYSRIGPADLVDRSVLEYIQSVARTEGGIFYITGDGKAKLVDRHASLTSTVRATFRDEETGAEDGDDFPYLADGAGIEFDRASIRNQVSAESLGIAPYRKDDATSQARYGVRSESARLEAYDADDLQWYCDQKVLDYADPIARFPALSVNVERLPSTIKIASWQRILDLDLGDMVTVERTPVTGTTITKTTRLEGVSHSYASGQWIVTVSVGAREVDQGVWVLGTSALSSTTKVVW